MDMGRGGGLHVDRETSYSGGGVHAENCSNRKYDQIIQ